jgi:transcriptional regulator with XRE-family HTH domain
MHYFCEKNMNYIGDTLKKMRVRQNKSQQEIADFVNIDRKTYANWENNTADIKGSYIPKLAEAFGVEISELFKSANNFHIKQKFENRLSILQFLSLPTENLLTRCLTL